MPQARALVFFAFVGLWQAGCARGPGRLEAAAPPPIAGGWRAASGVRVLDLALEQHGRQVTGEGDLRTPFGKTSHWVIYGRYDPPTVSLEFVNHDRIVARYVGRLEPSDTLRGVMVDAGHASDSLFFFRLRPQD